MSTNKRESWVRNEALDFVKKIEHGSIEHREWLRAEAVPHIEQALLAAYAKGVEDSAKVAFDKIRCDDRTDRWQVANEVAAHIRALGGAEAKG